MKYFILFSITCIGLFSCEPTPNEVETKMDYFKYYKYSNDSLILDMDPPNPISGNYYALSKNNGGGTHLDDLDDNNVKADSINIMLYADHNIVDVAAVLKNTIDETETINHILQNMNIGYQISIDTFRKGLETINTKGSVNKENIFNDLDMPFEKDKTYVFLFDTSEFFSTASAICLFNDDIPIIFGDANLMQSPMIFVHELGHSLGLTHSNTLVHDSCVAFNFMHESNIGCSYHITNRQILISKEDSYIPVIKNDSTNTTACQCNRDYMSNIIEGYVNSIDRNIDDTPAVENFDIYFDSDYKAELTRGVLNTDIEKELKLNYAKEFEVLVDHGDKDSYVSQRLEIHKKLRKNNLARWLEHYSKDNMVDLPLDESYYKNSSEFYEEKLNSRDSMICNNFVNELITKFIELEEIRSKLDSSDIARECYRETVEGITKRNGEDGEQFQNNIDRNNKLRNFLRSFISDKRN